MVQADDSVSKNIKNQIANAKRLEKLNEGKSPASSTPGTKVHELIEHLKME